MGKILRRIILSKKTHWTEFATLKLGDFHDPVKNCSYAPTKEQYAAYRRRMFKWGVKVAKMPIEKVSFNKKKKTEEEEN